MWQRNNKNFDDLCVAKTKEEDERLETAGKRNQKQKRLKRVKRKRSRTEPGFKVERGQSINTKKFMKIKTNIYSSFVEFHPIY